MMRLSRSPLICRRITGNKVALLIQLQKCVPFLKLQPKSGCYLALIQSRSMVTSSGLLMFTSHFCRSLALPLSPYTLSLAPFTQRSRIIAEEAVHQFSTISHSHTAKQLRLLKSCGSTCHDDDVCVFSRCFPGVLLLDCL